MSSDYSVLLRVTLANKYAAKGNTIHRRGDEVLPVPHSLQIAKYPDDNGYYLFYLDENLEQLTDTYHDDLNSALAQAEWEFGVQAAEWVKAS